MTREEAMTLLRCACATYGIWNGKSFTLNIPTRAMRINEVAGPFQFEEGFDGVVLVMPILKAELLEENPE